MMQSLSPLREEFMKQRKCRNGKCGGKFQLIEQSKTCVCAIYQCKKCGVKKEYIDADLTTWNLTLDEDEAFLVVLLAHKHIKGRELATEERMDIVMRDDV